jgi:hypothetical protein
MSMKNKEFNLESLLILLLIFITLVSDRSSITVFLFFCIILITRLFNKKLYFGLLCVYLLVLWMLGNRKACVIEKFATSSGELYNLIGQILELDLDKTIKLLKGKDVFKISDVLVFNLDLNKKQRNRLSAYIEYSKIYLFDNITIFKLIDKGIYDINKISKNLDFIGDKQILGYNYYIFKTSIDDRYFIILQNLNLSKHLNKNLVTYSDAKVKEMYEMMILFEYYELLGVTDIEEENGNNIATDIINFSVTDGIEGWVFKILKKLKDHNWIDDVFMKYDIKQLAIDKINTIKENYKYTLTNIETGKIDLGEINDNKDLSYNDTIKKYEKELFDNEYKTIEMLNGEVNKVPPAENYNLLNNLGKDTSNTLLNILDEIIVLFSDKIEHIDMQRSDNIWDNYLYYFNKIVKIIFKDGRILYLGVLMIILSIVFMFINLTK